MLFTCSYAVQMSGRFKVERIGTTSLLYPFCLLVPNVGRRATFRGSACKHDGEPMFLEVKSSDVLSGEKLEAVRTEIVQS